MALDQNSNVLDSWAGGFAKSNDDFTYPTPDLSSLPMLDNMANIPRIKRKLDVYWPEFSWQTKLGDESSRCFSTFANNISSIGYDNAGRIWSIICPQQGYCVPNVGCLNVEVTVTGQRGWVDETMNEGWIAADMTVEGKIWFSPSSHQNWFVKTAWDLFKGKSLPFPSNKANAIQVSTHKVGEPKQPIFPIRAGESSLIKAPDHFRHPETAHPSVANIEVEIGSIIKTHHSVESPSPVDRFNERVLDLFNIASNNMLLENNVLTWNLWFRKVESVNSEDWRTHAEKWRQSINADHGLTLPDPVLRNFTTPSDPYPRHADGSVLDPDRRLLTNLKELGDIIKIAEELLTSR